MTNYPYKPLPPLPASELFSYGPRIGPLRISIIGICVLIILTIVIVKSVFTHEDKRTFKEPEGGYKLYGENNQKFRLDTIIRYQNEIKEGLVQLHQQYAERNKMIVALSTANQSIGAVSIVAATTGIVSAVTVIGIPVSIGAAVTSFVFGATTMALSGVQRMKVKQGNKMRDKIFYLERANTDLDRIIAIGLDDKYSEISNGEFSKAQEIYNGVFKKTKLSNLGDLADLPLVPKN